MQVTFESPRGLRRIIVKLYPTPVYPNTYQLKSEDGLSPDKLLYGEIRYERLVEGKWVYALSFQKQRFLEFPSMTWETERDLLEGRTLKKGIYITYVIDNGKKYPRIYIVFKDNDPRGAAMYTLCPELFQEVHSGAIYPD